MKLFLLILTSILSIGLISWKDPTDISQNNDCIFRDTLVGYVDYDNVLDSIYIEKTSEYRYDDNDGIAYILKRLLNIGMMIMMV